MFVDLSLEIGYSLGGMKSDARDWAGLQAVLPVSHLGFVLRCEGWGDTFRGGTCGLT